MRLVDLRESVLLLVAFDFSTLIPTRHPCPTHHPSPPPPPLIPVPPITPQTHPHPSPLTLIPTPHPCPTHRLSPYIHFVWPIVPMTGFCPQMCPRHHSTVTHLNMFKCMHTLECWERIPCPVCCSVGLKLIIIRYDQDILFEKQ